MRSPIYSNRQSTANAVATWGKNADWVLPLDYIQLAFGAAVGGILSEDATGPNYTFFVTYDGMAPSDFAADAGFSQTTTTITVTDPLLPVRGGVTTGDIVRLFAPGTNIDGWYLVASTPSTTTYTVTSGVSQSLTANGKHMYWRLFPAPTALTAATTRISATISINNVGPATGLVLKTGAITGGSVTGVVVQGEGPG